MNLKSTGRAVAKALQGLVICALVVGIFAWVWPPALKLLSLWLVVGVSVIANVLQPRYRPFEGSRTPHDHGTARQILWTVYLTQALAMAELVVRRRQALPWDLLTVSAALIMICGLGLRTWAVVLLGRWFTWNVSVQPDQALVIQGPYRFIRHPSYVGAWLTFVASCVVLGSYATAWLAAALLWIAFGRRIRHEEALMLASVPGYECYRNSTGGFCPRFRHLGSRTG